MTDPVPNAVGDAYRHLRTLLLICWLSGSAVMVVLLGGLSLLDHHRHQLQEGEQAAHLVAAALRAPMTANQRQLLIESYGQFDHEDRVDGITMLLVLNPKGRVVYASRPTWRSLFIYDPLFTQSKGDDTELRNIARCFQRADPNCVHTSSDDWQRPLQGFSVARPVLMPAQDLGLPRQPFLVVTSFANASLLGNLLLDLPLLLLLSVLVSGLLCGGLWLTLSSYLVPRILEATQTDALTQLMNRTSFMDMAIALLSEAEDHHGEWVFAILDIDHFKQINDTYGHDCGDEALASLGSLLLTVTRPDDLVCRFGGEEFAMLLSANKDAGEKALERLRLQVEMNRLRYRGQLLELTVSIGAAATSDCGYNLDYLYKTADKALYAAKHAGRNRLEWNGAELMRPMTAASLQRS